EPPVQSRGGYPAEPLVQSQGDHAPESPVQSQGGYPAEPPVLQSRGDHPPGSPVSQPERAGAAGQPGDGDFNATAAASTRAVLLASMLGAAALGGGPIPLAQVFESHSPTSAWVLSTALAAFAPGLIGYGLSANLSRVLY